MPASPETEKGATKRGRPLAAFPLALATLLAGCQGTAEHTRTDSLIPPASTLPRSVAPASEVAPPPAEEAGLRGIGTRMTEIRGVEIKGPAPAGGRAAASRPLTGEDVSLDFVDADIATVVRSVLVDMLHLTVTVDPRVNGKITLQTSSPVRRDSVLALIEDAFRMNGAALVGTEGGWDVLPADSTRIAMGSIRQGAGRGPGWRTQIVPLRFASATAVQKSVQAIVPAGSAIHADPGSNSLILTGTGPEIAGLLDAVTAFDTDLMAGKSFGLWPLQLADVREVATALEGIFGHAEANDPTAPIRFLPIQRLNAILAVARDGASLSEARRWIAQLDRPGDGNEPQLFVYRVANGRAAYLAELLAKLYPDDIVDKAEMERDSKLPPDRPAAILQGASSGTSSSQPGPASRPGEWDRGTIAEDQGKVPGQPPQKNGLSLSALPGEGAAQRGEGTRIVADTVNNALLIQTRPALYQEIEKSLRKLDVMPAQVVIEATIVEVRLTDALSLGTQFFLNSGKNGFKFTPSILGTIGAVAPGFSYIWPLAGGTKVVVDALRAVTDVSLVSSPTMMVLANETAQLQVGDQVPVITSTAQSVQNAGAPLVSQVEYHDTGVILSVTPRINQGGIVMLDIRQEVSDVTNTTTSNIDSPTFQQRRFRSSVAVGDSETLLMGGLIRNNRNQTRTGIPWVSDIPVVGALFDDRKDSTDRTELLVMITPHILRSRAETAAAADEIRRRIEGAVTPSPKVLP